MYLVSKHSVTYVADRWRHALTGLVLLSIALLLASPMVIGFYFDGFAAAGRFVSNLFDQTNSSLVDELTFFVWIMTWMGFLITSIFLGFMKVINPDKIVISTQGFSISRYGSEKHYPWSDIGRIITIGGLPSSTFIDVAGVHNAIRFSAFFFGRRSDEIVGIINSAKEGSITHPTTWNLVHPVKLWQYAAGILLFMICNFLSRSHILY